MKRTWPSDFFKNYFTSKIMQTQVHIPSWIMDSFFLNLDNYIQFTTLGNQISSLSYRDAYIDPGPPTFMYNGLFLS